MYKSSFLMMFIVLVLVSTISMLFYSINKMEKWDKITSSLFECGFSSYIFNRFSFSSQYFFISMMFIFLDLEFCILMPYLFNMMMSLKLFSYMMMLILIILIGITLEWKFNSLNWKL